MSARAFRKVLVANRGEIAVRIVRACREMGILSVAVFSEADRAALHVRLADEAVPIGPAPSRESYLRIDRVLEAARASGADAIHPGYGFLAENAAFARAVRGRGNRLHRPAQRDDRPHGREDLGPARGRGGGRSRGAGDARAARREGEIVREAEGIGYPVMLKAAAGGGGKGLRLVATPAELLAALARARTEAKSAFGDDSVYLEKAIARPRHIEIQVLADQHGHAVHLFERECSIQRRHQKVIEESPSPSSTPGLRRRMGDLAVALVRRTGYVNAGTIEFLVDEDAHPYFLEMNTRLQVEHPVTEMVTGVDLVKAQIRIAQGEPLAFRQEDLAQRGHAIECRVYAEDPDHGFLPSPGSILALRVRADRECATTRASTRAGRSPSTTTRFFRSWWSGRRAGTTPCAACAARSRNTGSSGSRRRSPCSSGSSTIPPSSPGTSTRRSSTACSRPGRTGRASRRDRGGGGRHPGLRGTAGGTPVADGGRWGGHSPWGAAGRREAHGGRLGSQGDRSTRPSRAARFGWKCGGVTGATR